MANIKLGGGVTDIRGSIGGTTFSRGPAGAIARQRVKPINPASALQTARRAVVSYLSQEWSRGLTGFQRTDWSDRAATTNFLNKVGDTIQITGLSLFLRLNAMRILGNLPIMREAQLVSGLASGVVTTVSADVSELKVIVAEPTGGFDKTNIEENLFVFAGSPMAAGRTLSPSGFRYVGKISGGAAPPVFPQKFPWPYAAIVGQNYPMSITHQDLSFRLSTPVDMIAVVVP